MGGFNTADICKTKCGDGILIKSRENCDDGNQLNGDGCSSICKIEKGWSCIFDNDTSIDICTHICGNGVLDEYE